MNRVAIIMFWGLGDILMATPMLSAIHARYPDCEITWVENERWTGVFDNHPDIAEVLTIPVERHWRKWRKFNPLWWMDTHRYRQMIRERDFDVVINCHPEKWWTALLCLAREKVGVVRKPVAAKQEGIPVWTKRVYTHLLHHVPGTHLTKHNLSATRALGIPDAGYDLTIGQTPDEEPFFRRFIDKYAPGHKGAVAVVAPFSTQDNKCWDAASVAALCDRLRERFGALPIITMSAKDTPEARAIASLAKTPPVLAEGTTLREYIALLRYADFAVTMDSSAMHLCAALGTPYITLWGATSEQFWRPLARPGVALRHPLPCAPCQRTTCANAEFRACMNGIRVEAVEEAIQGLRPANG